MINRTLAQQKKITMIKILENNKKSSQKQKNNKEDVTEQEAEDMVYDWYKKSSYGARLRNEFHVTQR